jgi:hypothetical protein
MGPVFMTPCELAERWKVTEGALRSWRSQGLGPKFIKLGKGTGNAPIRYPMEEIVRIESENRFEAIRINYRKPD